MLMYYLLWRGGIKGKIACIMCPLNRLFWQDIIHQKYLLHNCSQRRTH